MVMGAGIGGLADDGEPDDAGQMAATHTVVRGDLKVLPCIHISGRSGGSAFYKGEHISNGNEGVLRPSLHGPRTPDLDMKWTGGDRDQDRTQRPTVQITTPRSGMGFR